MTLEEAVVLCRNQARDIREGIYDAIALGEQNISQNVIAKCETYAENYEQIAVWLEELNEIRNHQRTI